MNLEIQFKLKNNPLYIDFLHENSYWYKILNRFPEKYEDFLNEVKTKYKLRKTDKILEMFDAMETLSNIISSLK